MAFLGNLIFGAVVVLNWALSIYMWIIIIRALLSFVNPDPFNPIVRALNRATDPVMYWVRRHIPTDFGGLDFSPLLIIISIQFVQRVVLVWLLRLALSWGAGR